VSWKVIDVSSNISYRDAGVDIDKADRIVNQMRQLVSETWTDGVARDFGGFAAAFEPNWQDYKNPRLLACTDGVGTKLKLARKMDRLDSAGIDCVAMVVNDLITSGAKPLFFLDYISSNELKSDEVLQIVSGLAEGCKKAGCALIGGETAEMPGTYAEDDYEVVGFGVGIMDSEDSAICRQPKEGDLLIGLPSSGLHSNGFSLVRKLIDDKDWELSDIIEPLDRSLGQELIEPTRIYVKPVMEMMETGASAACAHITGGGLLDNVRRILPGELEAKIDWDNWQRPAVFSMLAQSGQISEDEMRRTFNLGVGMVLVARADQQDEVHKIAIEHDLDSFVIGEVVRKDEY